MFAVIYRNFVKEGMERQFKEAWRTVATLFIEQYGALGSCLHQTDEGMWLAYSRWPDKKTRDKVWPEGESINHDLPDHVMKSIINLKKCLDPNKSLPEISMTVEDDLLLQKKNS